MIQTNELNKFDLFADLKIDDIEKIQPLLQVSHHRAGTDIYKAGEPSEHLYIVISGEVNILHNIDGEIITLAHLYAGLFFGEAGILGNKEKHQTRALAVSDSSVLALSSVNTERLKKNHPQIAITLLNNIARILASRLDIDTVRIGVISALSKLISDPENLHNTTMLAQSVLRITLAAMPSKKAFIGVYPAYLSGEIHILASVGIDAKELPKRQQDDNDTYLSKIRHNDYMLLTSAKYLELPKVRYAKKNLLAQSIKTDERSVGVIVLADKDGGEFTARNQLLLRIIAGHIAFTIEASQRRQEQKASEELKRKYVGI